MRRRGDYRYVMDNVMDPMHGTFLHQQSHSMAEGDIGASISTSTMSASRACEG